MLTGVHFCCAGSCGSVWLQPWWSKGERLFARRHPCSMLTGSDSGNKTTPRGFEPLRAEPNGFRVHLLSRSDTVSCDGTLSNWPHKAILEMLRFVGSADCKPLAALSLNFVFSMAWPICGRDTTFRKGAASEDRTHDLRIMRPTRCQLRYRRCKKVNVSKWYSHAASI